MSQQPSPSPEKMPAQCSEHLRQALQHCRCYLEYGLGDSTRAAAEANIPQAVLVESDRAWLKSVHDEIAGRAPPDWHFLHIDIGRTRDWGFPAGPERWHTYHRYPLDAWDLCRAQDLHPDLILIDGRFRAACFMAAMLFGRPGCRVLFDDYFPRPQYHVVEAVAKPLAQIERMAEFVIPKTFDREAGWQILCPALFDLW